MEEDERLSDTIPVPGSLAVPKVPENLEINKALVKARVQAGLFQKVRAPTRIGRFTLIERLGAGAMGEVYAAYDDQLDRKVAVKIVRPDHLAGAAGDADSSHSRRLLREAQTLARLSHPNVVQVYEAGIVQGRVYLAMEFIRGKSLSEWLKKEADVPEPEHWQRVLAMFVAAGRGLAAAHEKGLIHRDFKPANVLVGDDGRVCVADFGLARPEQEGEGSATASELDSQATAAEVRRPASLPPPPRMNLTETRVRIGTPAYMSPEQVECQPTDQRSDQFNFCVSLCEGLYGKRPFQGDTTDQLYKHILSGSYDEPPPGTQVPARLWKALQRGLSLSPADRYPDMGALLEALLADPGKRLRRRLLTAGLLCAGVLVGGVIAKHAGSTAQENPCAHAGQALKQTWNPEIAGRAAAAFRASGLPYAAATWNAIASRMDAYTAELAAARRDSCAATYIRKEQPQESFGLQAVCLDRRERHLEALVGEFVRADASTVEQSAMAVAELPRIDVCRDSESLMLGVEPPDNPETAAAVSRIRGELARARMQELSGHAPEALILAETIRKATDSLAYPPVRAEALHQAGILYRDRAAAGDLDRAQELLLEALDIAESHRHDELVSQIWLDLVRLARQYHSDFAIAQQWARRALSTASRVRDRGEKRSEALSMRGYLYGKQGKLDVAEQHQREALALAQESGAPALKVAGAWHELAITLDFQSRIADADAAYGQALALHRAELGDGHPRTARFYADYGMFLRNTGNFERARELFGKALAARVAIHARSAGVANIHLALADLEQQAGNLEKAAEHARLGRDISAAVDDPDSRAQARAEEQIGMIAFRRQRFEEALAAFERALALRQRALASHESPASLNDYHRGVGILQSSVGETLAALGRYEEALAMSAAAESSLVQAGDLTSPVAAAMPLKVRGLALLGQGKAGTAREPLERALKLIESQPGYPIEQADIQWALARALHTAGRGPQDDREARALAQRAQALYQANQQTEASQAILAWLAESTNNQATVKAR